MQAQATQRTSSTQDSEIYEEEVAKSAVIIDACGRGDIDDLRKLAISKGGFLTDSLRSRAWRVLLGFAPKSQRKGNDDKKYSSSTARAIEIQEIQPYKTGNWLDTPWKDLPRHQDEDQVRLDVDRSFIYYPTGQNQTQLDIKKSELSDLITETLRRQPHLCYFQGYHDICQVFLLVLPPELRVEAVARLSALRIRDFMLPNLTPAISQLRLIPDILNSVDPALCRHLSQTEPFFALSGTLTMYAHDIQSYSSISRLFDALLAREQVFSVYMFAQIVLNRRAELFNTPADEPEMLHSILSKLPQPLDLDGLITDTAALFNKHPPETLRSWRHGISEYSVLKTARYVKICASQTLDEGKRLFERQLAELQWAEKREKLLKTAWTYRKPARSFALAILVGVAAVYLRKSPSAWGYFAALWSKLN